MKRLALPLLAALALTGCGSSADDATRTSAAPAAGAEETPSGDARVTGRITVFAAASLRETFTSLEKTFEKKHPGADVVLSFGPSSGLAAQITQGAPADVFASAAPANMEQVTEAGAATDPRVFARNRMTIVTPGQNPRQVTGVESLAESDVKTAVCQKDVPCGAVAAKVFDKAGVTVTPATEEVDVKAVLTKVRLGEVDAGVVYVTDAKAADGKVRSITIPEDQNASTDYPIATLGKAPNPAGARAFVELVHSERGRTVLTAAGFAPPR